MKTIVENINRILAEWDPIGVGNIIATDEYRGYSYNFTIRGKIGKA